MSDVDKMDVSEIIYNLEKSRQESSERSPEKEVKEEDPKETLLKETQEPQKETELQENQSEEESNEPEVETETEAVIDEIKPEVKAYSAHFGDQKIDIPVEAVIDITTKKGDKAQVTLEELKSDYWGKQAISKKVQELEDLKTGNKEIIKLHETLLSRSDKLKGAEQVNQLLSNLVAVNPALRESITDFIASLYHEGARLSSMSDQERETFFLDKENRNLKADKQSQEMMKTEQQINYHVAAKKEQLQKSYNLDDSQWTSQVQELVNQGKLTDETPLETAFQVIEHKLHENVTINRLSTVMSVLEEMDPELAKSDDAVMDLFAIYDRKPSMNLQDLKSKATSLFGYNKVKEVNDKIKQKEKITGIKTNNSNPTKKTFKTQTDDLANDPIKKFLRDKGAENLIVGI